MKKALLTLTFLLLLSLECFSQETFCSTGKQIIVQEGISLGSVLAMVISWSRNRSVLYAILHGIFSWFYVIYFLIVRDKKDKQVASA